MKLMAGDRLRLAEGEFVLAVSGRIEVYAVTKEKAFFRQMFLMEIGSGEAAFPAYDELGYIDVSLYAVSDADVEIHLLEDFPAEKLQGLMKGWFRRLAELPYFRLLADKGDDVIQSWAGGRGLDGFFDATSLPEKFKENERIFSMLLTAHFRADDKQTVRRMDAREKTQAQFVDEAVSHLLGEDAFAVGNIDTGNRSLEEAVYIMRIAAHGLAMPTDAIKIAPEIAEKLDQTRLLRRLAQKGNMQTRLVELEKGWSKKDCGVMIGWYNVSSGEKNAKKVLAALIPETPGHYRLFSLNHGKGIPVTEETERQLDDHAFACYAGFPSKVLGLADMFRFMLRQCWRADLRIILVASMLAGLIPLITPIITETIFRDIIPILDRKTLATVTQVSLVSSFTLAALSACRAIALLRITSQLDMATEAALWGRLLTLPTGFFRRFQSGELANRLMGLENVKGILSTTLVSTLFNFIFSFWSLFLMCYYSLKLTAVAVLIWAVYCLLQAVVFRNLQVVQRELVAAKNRTAGVVQQIFAGLPKFRVRGSESQAFYLWGKAFGDEWDWNFKLRWQNNKSALLASIQPLLLALALYYVAYDDTTKAILKGSPQDAISYSKFMAFTAAYTGFNTALGAVFPLLGQLFSIRPMLENLQPILEERPETSDDRMDAGPLCGSLEISGLCFAYRDGAPDVLHDVNFRVTAGEHVAIVGKSGCGKSTLIRLLLGFEQPQRGSILYDGQDLSDLNPVSVRSQMGIVLQNGQLMVGDIFTNIVGNATLTQDDAWTAAEAAGIAEDIRQMPMGMQTVISEGSGNISGGQRQRILIARALAARPAILVFDEATSALDNQSQAIVTESLNRLKATRLVVAHRLSTIRDCDRILVLDKGRIAESGTFEELEAKGGIFTDMVRRQTA